MLIMNEYTAIIESAISTYTAELAKIKILAKTMVDLSFSKDISYSLFSKDSDVHYYLNQPNAVLKIEKIYNDRLVQSLWRSFFNDIELYSALGVDLASKITGRYEIRYNKFDVDAVFTVENLTRFVNDHLKLDTSKDAEIPKHFLRIYVGKTKTKPTEYKARVTIADFKNEYGSLNDRVQHSICELASYISRNHQHNAVQIKDIKSKINFNYGDNELDCTLIDGIDFRLKSNGNAELKLSKDIVSFLNNSL